MSTDLQWLLIRNYNSFLKKGGNGKAFSAEKVRFGLGLVFRMDGRTWWWGMGMSGAGWYEAGVAGTLGGAEQRAKVMSPRRPKQRTRTANGRNGWQNFERR
jgi:hypothetical protein